MRFPSDRHERDHRQLGGFTAIGPACGFYGERGDCTNGQTLAQVRPLVEFLGVAELEWASDVADRTARVVFGEVDFDMKRGGAEGFAFKRADTFLDRVNDDFGFHFHDWISLRPMN